MNVLVTGAAGFIGTALIARLLRQPSVHRILAVSRNEKAVFPQGIAPVRVGDCGPDTDWRPALSGVDVVIHAAGRVHETERGGDALAAFSRVNTEGTLNLARQAMAAGVRRLVFLSTIKVNGEATAGQPYRPEDSPAPAGPYGVSKREAEDGLRSLARDGDIELVIVRPPLVYGPGVRANFLSLMRWVDRGLPLPSVRPENRRSLIYLGNLADLLVRCVEYPAAAGETFLASDGEDVSTDELVRRLAQAMGRPARLFPLPPSMVRALPGAEGLRRRLFESLQVDAARTRERLGWTPPFSLEEGLAETVRWYRQRRPSS